MIGDKLIIEPYHTDRAAEINQAKQVLLGD